MPAASATTLTALIAASICSAAAMAQQDVLRPVAFPGQPLPSFGSDSRIGGPAYLGNWSDGKVQFFASISVEGSSDFGTFLGDDRGLSLIHRGLGNVLAGVGPVLGADPLLYNDAGEQVWVIATPPDTLRNTLFHLRDDGTYEPVTLPAGSPPDFDYNQMVLTSARCDAFATNYSGSSEVAALFRITADGGFARIARTGEQAPGLEPGEMFDALGAWRAVDSSRIVFWTQITVPGSLTTRSVLFVSDDSGTRPLAGPGGLFTFPPGVTLTDISLQDVSDRGDMLLYANDGASGERQLFLAGQQGLTRIVGTGDLVPDVPGLTYRGIATPRISPNGSRIVWVAAGNFQTPPFYNSALYAFENGQVHFVARADESTTYPPYGYALDDIREPAIADDGTIAFHGLVWDSGTWLGTGLYIRSPSGSIRAAYTPGDWITLPDGRQTPSAEIEPTGAFYQTRSIDRSGRVAFLIRYGVSSYQRGLFIVGSKADSNRDGILSTLDVLDFIGAWLAGDPRADFDGSGALTVTDLFDFLDAWFEGA
jgi:hypothetical protein